MAKFTIQASTPAEFQQAVVKWLNDQSVAIRSQGRISKGKRVQHDRYTEAEALESAARFISEVVIEPVAKPLEYASNDLTGSRLCD